MSKTQSKSFQVLSYGHYKRFVRFGKEPFNGFNGGVD